MCLTIITHIMVCDIRPVMPHPSDPDILVVDPYVPPRAQCCVISTAPTDNSNGKKCPLHPCCKLTTKTFSCGCNNELQYRRYEPANDPVNYTEATEYIPGQGGWRKLHSLDFVLPEIEDNQRTEKTSPSDMLRVARRGREFTLHQVLPIIDELEAASERFERAEKSFANGGPVTEYEAGSTALEQLVYEASELKSDFEAWIRTQDALEISEGRKGSLHRWALPLRRILRRISSMRPTKL
ncbi:hypothetical protein GGR51DRAFT_561876 [Nemania sp. FL0031]|nr:hypothetical protein GGR51DRAFT_561876 [Nemania sp. FL0031]